MRRRPLSCPFCGADVKERIECASCGEPLPGVPVRPPLHAARRLGRLALSLAIFTHLVLSESAFWAPHLAVFAAAILLFVALWLRRPLLRLEQRVATWAGWTRLALPESAGGSDGPLVTLEGRVRLITPCEAGSGAAAVIEGGETRAGRFLVEGPRGAALVDDEHVVLGPHTFVVLEGDHVEVRGLAQREAVPSTNQYRRGDTLTVFEGSATAPILVCAIPAVGG